MKKKLLSLLFYLPLVGQAQNIYNYGFNGTTADLTTAGWVRTNQSTSASRTLWTVASYTPVVVSATVNPTPFQTQADTTGQTCPIPNGQDGTPNTFALVNFTSTSSSLTSGATIGNWLISPVVTVQNGDVISFYTRLGKYSATNAAFYADNLQVRMCTNGAATVDPSTGPTAVKIGFRYFVTNGGPNGSNSDIIGIDTFSVDRPLGTQDFFAKNFVIFPNPAKEVLNIAAKNGMDIKGIQITDLNGRIVKSAAVQTQPEAQINIADLSAGAYFVSVQTNEGTTTSKFFKN